MSVIAAVLAMLVPTGTAAGEAAQAAAAEAPKPPLPEWMAGCWTSGTEQQWSEECWMGPRGGMMLGMSRSGTAARVSEWEVMRIETSQQRGDGSPIGMAFKAAPMGQTWTTFAWSPDKLAGVSFINVANDFPQRIRYWREGETLKAEIAQADGSRAKKWSFTRADPAAPGMVQLPTGLPAQITPPSVKPPSITPPSVKPPSITPPSVSPPSVTPPSLKRPKVNPPRVQPGL